MNLICQGFSRKKKKEALTKFMQARFFKKRKAIGYYKTSSIWYGIGEAVQTLQLDVSWNIGTNSSCSTWFDDWTSQGTLSDIVPIPAELWYTRNMLVGDFIVDGMLNFLQPLLLLFQNNNIRLEDVTVPGDDAQDELIWEGSATGKLTVRSTYEQYREKNTIIQLYGKLWKPFIPPKISIFI